VKSFHQASVAPRQGHRWKELVYLSKKKELVSFILQPDWKFLKSFEND